MGVVTGLLFLLQNYNMSDFWKKKGDTTFGAIIFFIGVAIIIAVLVIVNMMKNRGKVAVLNGIQKTPAPKVPRRFSPFTLHRLASSAGLNPAQIKMLDYVFKNDAVTDPQRSFSSPELLDRHFKRAYHTIERTIDADDGSDDDAQQRLSVLFSTRNAIEANTGSTAIYSTRQIPENAAVVLNTGEASYPVKVVSTKDNNLLVTNPQNAKGGAVHISRGGKVTLSYFVNGGRGFSFESRVTGEPASHGTGQVLPLAHSNQVKQLLQRRFRRRQVDLATDFSLVRLEDAGRKEKKMIVDKRRLTGNITDISTGGCSINTNATVTAGTRLKIEFSKNKTAAAALGQALRINRSGMRTVIHVKFLKVPRRSMNIINAMVFEYLEN